MSKLYLAVYDGQGGSTGKTYEHDGTGAAADTYAPTLLGLLGTVSGLGVSRTKATESITNGNTTHKRTADANSNKDEGITIGVTLTDGSGATIKYPCPKRDATGFVYVVDGKIPVDDADHVSLVSAFAVDGFGDNSGSPGPLSVGGKKVTGIDYIRLDK